MKSIPILKKEKFTTFYFYNNFLKDIEEYYKVEYIKSFEPIKFHLHDLDFFYDILNEQYIDPLSLPLILSIGETLKKLHREPIELDIKISSMQKIIAFLHQNKFFEAATDRVKINSTFNIDLKSIMAYDYKINKNHKVRKFTHDTDYQFNSESFENDLIRDRLLSNILQEVKIYFIEILELQFKDPIEIDFYINIISEIIANGLFYSNSNVYAVMIVDTFNTKFSISDSGIGFYESVSQKKENAYSFGKMSKKIEFDEIFKPYEKSLVGIFEGLYYSLLKERYGLFDLMLNVVLEKNGKIRIHSDNVQLIFTNSLLIYLNSIEALRKSYFIHHNRLLFELEVDKNEIFELINKIEECFLLLVKNILIRYRKDIRYSLVRFNDVTFNGVHIEVEIPINKI